MGLDREEERSEGRRSLGSLLYDSSRDLLLKSPYGDMLRHAAYAAAGAATEEGLPWEAFLHPARIPYFLSNLAGREHRGKYRGLNMSEEAGYNYEEEESPPDLMAMYLGLPGGRLPEQELRPTSLTQHLDLPFYSAGREYLVPENEQMVTGSREQMEQIANMRKGEVMEVLSAYDGRIPASPPSLSGILDWVDEEESTRPRVRIESPLNLGRATVSIGRDEKGHFVSVFDVWDFANKGGERPYASAHVPPGLRWLANMQAGMLDFVGNPFAIYDRIYFDPSTGRPVGEGWRSGPLAY